MKVGRWNEGTVATGGATEASQAMEGSDIGLLLIVEGVAFPRHASTLQM